MKKNIGRLYEPVWKRIAKNEKVTLTCHETAVLKITRAMYKEKSRNKLVKDAVEIPSYGRMTVIKSPVASKPGFVTLTFELTYSGGNL